MSARSLHVAKCSITGLVMAVAVACRPGGNPATTDAHLDERGDANEVKDALANDTISPDGLDSDGGVPFDAPPDGPPPPPPPPSIVVYPEGVRHSPITPAIVARLEEIAAAASRDPKIFAKAGDSNSASNSFVRCFDGGSVDLGSNTALASTIDHFLQGDAGGDSPFVRESACAVSGWTAREAITGAPSPFASEVAAINPQTTLIMYGTNEARFGRSLDAFGTDLWTLVDDAIARGVVPVLSTIPPINTDASADARVGPYNRVIRAIAQGRQIPLIDLHRELVSLPNRGLVSDGVHLSVASSGACTFSSSGLAYGHNLRNLMSMEALARVLAALGGSASDASAPMRAGTGRVTDPFTVALPFTDLADTRIGTSSFTTYSCGGPAQRGREVVYRVDQASSATIRASIVDRSGVDVHINILAGSASPTACVASGASGAVATVGPGSVFIVIDTPSSTTEGEYLLVVERL